MALSGITASKVEDDDPKSPETLGRPRPSLLQLPAHLRRAIYCLLGVPMMGHITLCRRPSPFFMDTKANLPAARKLLLVCRTIYTEVSLMLYGTNTLLFRCEHLQDFSVIQNLGRNVISVLTYLNVHLTTTSCHDVSHYPQKRPTDGLSHNGHESVLIQSSEYRSRIAYWRAAMEHMLPAMQPLRLRLHLVCDVDNFATAKDIVAPIYLTNTLADCAVRLGYHRDTNLSKLAQRTALQAMSKPYPSESAFRYLDLPVELRRHILEFTDLIAPLKEIQWDSRAGYHLKYASFCCLQKEYGSCPEHMHHSCQFRNCWEYAPDGCFCRRYHSAFDSRCNCWAPPASLFLISRSFRREALAVFFESNRFIVIPPRLDVDIKAVTEDPPRLDAAIFLKEVIPMEALPFLRDLEILLPPFEGKFLVEDGCAHRDWIETIKFCGGKVNPPKMTVRIRTLLEFKEGSLSFSMLSWRNDLAQRKRAIMLTLIRICNPLQVWRGLSVFFVDMEWPCFTGSKGYVSQRSIEQAKTRKLRFEKLCGQMVMGPEFDVARSQHAMQQKSQWSLQLEDGSYR